MRMNDRKLGAAIRVFALSPEAVPLRVAMVIELLEKLFSTMLVGNPFVHEAVVLIPTNVKYADTCDCGLTRQALVKAIAHKSWGKKVSVITSGRDDFWGSLPNFGMWTLARKGCDWGLMISSEVTGWNEQVCSRIHTAAKEGANIISLSICGNDELTQVGVVSNQFTVWDLARLSEAGGFAPLNHPLIAPHVPSLFTAKTELGAMSFSAVGGEEGVTSLLMVEKGARIAFVDPQSRTPQRVPRNPAEHTRWRGMIATKSERIYAAVQAARLNLKDLRPALMGTF